MGCVPRRSCPWRRSAPWQVFASLHTATYNQLLDEPGVLQRAKLAHAVSLLYGVRQRGFRTGLATMSYHAQVQRVLQALSWADLFDAVATADDVARGKPDPEVYLRVAQALRVRPEGCLVIEDSPSGVTGALAAGMGCIAVPTDLTRAAVHRTHLDKRWIVDDVSRLRAVVEHRLDIKDARPRLEG
jgi:HAD superfamily hydrolase (TIGR01509 family)